MEVSEWEVAIEAIWSDADSMSDEQLREAIAELAATYPLDDGGASFEVAGSWDSTGHADKAIPFYEEAIAAGLSEQKRRRAVIQMASSMRNVGRFAEALALLEGESEETGDGLDDAVVAFRALAMSDLGHTREALADTLEALAAHLPRYQRSVANYASLLRETEPGQRLE